MNCEQRSFSTFGLGTQHDGRNVSFMSNAPVEPWWSFTAMFTWASMLPVVKPFFAVFLGTYSVVASRTASTIVGAGANVGFVGYASHAAFTSMMLPKHGDGLAVVQPHCDAQSKVYGCATPVT